MLIPINPVTRTCELKDGRFLELNVGEERSRSRVVVVVAILNIFNLLTISGNMRHLQAGQVLSKCTARDHVHRHRLIFTETLLKGKIYEGGKEVL